MGEVEAAFAGDQEFAPHRALGFIDVYLEAGGARDFRGHQSCGATTDHGKASVGHGGCIHHGIMPGLYLRRPGSKSTWRLSWR